MRNVRLRIAYDGARFFGWQRQDGFDSVQQALEEALLDLTGSHAVVHGAGRTDSGVHALGQVAHVHVETRLDDDRLRHALNARLTGRAVVLDAETCDDAFHARFDALSKRYAYLVATTRFRPPFLEAHCHWSPWPLDLAAMRRARDLLVGRHDFRGFSNTGSPRRTTTRHLQRLHVVARRRWLAFVIQADGFLYNMARTLAGTLLDIGRGKLAVEAAPRTLASGLRTDAGPTAPPGGLYLLSVQYPGHPFARGAERGRGAVGAFGTGPGAAAGGESGPALKSPSSGARSRTRSRPRQGGRA